MRSLRTHHILIPLLALLAIVPLLVHGCSCGHDQPFHVQSWLDAAQQFHQGTIYPHWAFSPAWQAGEPRFLFYPPLSWYLGALLTMIFPMNAAPVVFTWIALTGAGFSMHYVVRRFAPREIALVCAGVYMANPYMLFNAFERGAYAELLAATWIPLVLLSMLQEELSVPALAVPLGMTWLTNAPAGVMATYAVALLAAVRLVFAFQAHGTSGSRFRASSLRIVATVVGGSALGLGLVAFYLLPAAYERRYVQVAMAIIPNLRYQDNFLFSKTDYAAHNEITFSVSVLALVLVLITLLVTLAGVLQRNGFRNSPPSMERFSRHGTMQLVVSACVIAFLLTPASSFVWEHLPNLKYLQFPWRLLSILSAVLGFALAPLLSQTRFRRASSGIAAALLVIGLSQLGSHLYRQGCERSDYPAFEAAAFQSSHGVLPTDEYTPEDADNDVQRTDDPGYWLVSGSDPNEPAPGTVANPNETTVNYDGPIPFENTVAVRAPMHLSLSLPSPRTLILNLRDYPAWRITRNGAEFPVHLHRDDGLVAVPLPAGASTIDVRWHRSWDQTLGVATSLCAFLVLAALSMRSRKIRA